MLPMFVPSHIGGQVPPINFGEVFDVPRLARGIRRPVLEWHQVKNSSSRELDELGCWNTWEAVQQRDHFPRRSVVPNLLSLGEFSCIHIMMKFTESSAQTFRIPKLRHGLRLYHAMNTTSIVRSQLWPL